MYIDNNKRIKIKKLPNLRAALFIIIKKSIEFIKTFQEVINIPTDC